MWFKALRNLYRQRVSFRLTLWYSAFLLASFGVAFFILNHNLATSLQTGDLEILKGRFKALISEYHDGGVDRVRRACGERRFGPLIIRMADPGNRTLFTNFSDPEVVKALNEFKPVADGVWARFSLPSGGELEIATSHTRDGTLLQIGRISRHRQIFLARFRREAEAVLAPIMLLGLVGGAFLAGRALEPLHRVNAAARRIIETGDVSARLSDVRDAGELRELVLSFNLMLDRIESVMGAMRDSIDNVAHDLRTPLTRLRGIAELALRNPADPSLSREALADCVEEVDRIMTLLNALMDISEIESGTMNLDLQPTDFPDLVREAAEIYSEIAEERGLRLEIATEGSFLVRADPARLRQAVANLVDNAVKYTPAGGCIRVSTEAREGEGVCTVVDSGPGIPPDDFPKIWTRLYRGDSSRSKRGLGLGLCLVAASAGAHKGAAEVENVPGGGARFTLRVPMEEIKN